MHWQAPRVADDVHSPVRPPRVTLHLIRTDVLLWTLGGFRDSVDDRPFREPHAPYLPWQIAEMRKLAAELPLDAKTGQVRRFAEKAGLSPRAVSVYLHHIRRGTEPRSWARRMGE